MNMKRIWCIVMVCGMGLMASVMAQQAQPVAAAPVAPVAEKAAPIEPAWDNTLPAGRLTMGLHFGDQQAESSGDVLVPIMQFKSGLLFINPRGAWNDDDGQEFNLGLGYRHLFPNRNIILGANMFYDLRNTALDNTFNQFGAGLEFLSTWVDARMNVYLPESGKKTADEYLTADSTVQERENYWYAPSGQGHLITQYGYDVASTYDVKTLQHYQISEQAMEGWDSELGVLLPIPVVRHYADIKVFGGYYDYNAHYGDDIAGMKARLEVKPLPSLYLDAAWFEDKELIGSYYSVGARVSVPFDLANLSRGKNPFAGALDGFKPGAAKPPFASRMTEMVVRDLHVRTDQSAPEEIVPDRQILQKTLTGSSRKDYTLVLASGVTFVDDDNRSSVEDGSWENPYRQINTGVQNAIGTMVYVRDAAQQYYENVVLRDGLTLWGSGAPIYGQGNRFLGGIYPVVNGMGTGPAIRLANGVTVAGFEITQPASTLPLYDAPGSKTSRRNQGGIYGENVTDVSIFQNYIHGTVGGINIYAQSLPSFNAYIADNRIEGVYSRNTKGSIDPEGAIGIRLFGIPQAEVTLANNNVTRCFGSGVSIYADGNDGETFIARISGNYSGNSGDGILLEASNYLLAAGLFVDTVANDNGQNGIDVNLYNNQIGAALFASHADLQRVDQLVNTVAGGLSQVLPLDLGSGFSVGSLLGLSDLYRNGGVMQANGNGDRGILVSQQSSFVNLAALIGVQADGNGSRYFTSKYIGGDGIEVEQTGYNNPASISVAALIRCQANGNRGAGMQVTSSADSLALGVFIDVRANDNDYTGITADISSANGMAGALVFASDPLLSLVSTLTSGPLLSDYVDPMDMSFIPAYGQVQANRNGYSGIDLNVRGQDLALGVVLDAQANGNGYTHRIGKVPSGDGNGIELNVGSETGPAIGVVGSTEGLMALVSSVLDFDLSQIRTLGPLQANDNANSGISIFVSSQQSDALAGIIGVEALRNGFGRASGSPAESGKNGGGQDGIYLDVHAYDGNAMAGLAWINASGNESDGVYASVRADSLDGEAMLGGIYLKANDNRVNGLELDVLSQSMQSSYLVLAGVEANRNLYGSGVDVRLGGTGVMMAALTGIQANDNGAQGINVETSSNLDAGSNGNSHVWISGTAVQDMSDHGGGFDVLGTDIISLLPSGGIEAGGNGESGIKINSHASGNNLVVVEDVVATGNGVNGIDIAAVSEAGHADLYLNRNTASGNGTNGIVASLTATNRTITLYGRDNVAKNNGDDGIEVTTQAGGGMYDFGTGTGTNGGNNAMVGNAGFGLNWVDNSGHGESFSAQNNYWGATTNYSGNIVAVPYLTDDPSLP